MVVFTVATSSKIPVVVSKNNYQVWMTELQRKSLVERDAELGGEPALPRPLDSPATQDIGSCFSPFVSRLIWELRDAAPGTTRRARRQSGQTDIDP